MHMTQGEASVASFGRTILGTFNDSAGMHVAPNPSGPGLITDLIFLSAFSTSTDGGQTRTKGFFPPLAGGRFTLGDPAVGVADPKHPQNSLTYTIPWWTQ
jgi:hypothetical protein